MLSEKIGHIFSLIIGEFWFAVTFLSWVLDGLQIAFADFFCSLSISVVAMFAVVPMPELRNLAVETPADLDNRFIDELLRFARTIAPGYTSVYRAA